VSLQGLSVALGFEVAPQEIIDRVYDVYAQIDHEIQANTQNLNLPCKAGCDACCHESVFLSAPEFLVVCAELISSRTPEALKDLVEEMRGLAEDFEDEIEFLEIATPGRERDEVAARIKFRCPLLSSDGLCSVYGARELNGRSFGHTWDSRNKEAYGCTLTREHLRILDQDTPQLPDARQARMALVEAVPLTERVQVYPWWFTKYGEFLA